MKPIFNPTPDQTFELEGRGEYNFVKHNEHIDALIAEGRFTEACEARYQAFLLLADVLPEDEPMPLRWEHANSRAAIVVLHGSPMRKWSIAEPCNTTIAARLLACSQRRGIASSSGSTSARI